MKKWISLLVMMAVGFGILLEHFFLQMWQAKPWFHLSTTMIYLPNGESTTVRVNVRNAHGTPVTGAEVWVTDTSGSSHSKTDGAGTAVFKIFEVPIQGISVNKREVLMSNFLRAVPTGIDVYYVEDSSQ